MTEPVDAGPTPVCVTHQHRLTPVIADVMVKFVGAGVVEVHHRDMSAPLVLVPDRRAYFTVEPANDQYVRVVLATETEENAMRRRDLEFARTVGVREDGDY